LGDAGVDPNAGPSGNSAVASQVRAPVVQ
jgi:hypothetical protein